MDLKSIGQNLAKGLAGISPEQRASLLRAAAANARGPVGAKGLMDQANQIIALQEAEKEAARKQAIEAMKEQAQMDREVYKQNKADARALLSAQTQAQRNARALGLEPGSPEYNDYIRQVTTKPLTSSTTNVTVDQKAEDAFQKKIGEMLSDEIARVEPARRALSAIQYGRSLMPLLQNTGPATPFIANLASLGRQFGADEEWLGSLTQKYGGDFRAAQAFGGVTADLISKYLDDQKGNLNKNEFEVVRNAVPELTNSAAGNEILFTYAEAASQRQMEIAKIALQPGLSVFEKQQRILDLKAEPLLNSEQLRAIEQAAPKSKGAIPPPRGSAPGVTSPAAKAILDEYGDL